MPVLTALKEYGQSKSRHRGTAMKSQDGKYSVGNYEDTFQEPRCGIYHLRVYYPSTELGASAHPCRSDSPYPAIIFAHGLGANYEMYKYMPKHLGSKGYIYLLFNNPSRFEFNIPTYAERITASINYLLHQNSDSGSLLYGMVDQRRIVVEGHSMGCMAAIVASVKDTRIAATILLAPPNRHSAIRSQKLRNRFLRKLDFEDAENQIVMVEEALRHLNKPTQIQYGTKDAYIGEAPLQIFRDIPTQQKQLVKIEGGNHIQFMDSSPIVALFAGDNKPDISTEDVHGISLNRKIVFLNRYL